MPKPGPLLFIAQIGGAHGVRGEVKIATFTSDPLAVAAYGGLEREDGGQPVVVLSARPTKGGVIARLDGVEDRTAAEALRGVKLFIPRDRLPEPEADEYYLADLIGLSVETPEGETLGVVKTVQDFGAGDLLEVQPRSGPSWWLPFTREAVPDVQIAQGRLLAVPPTMTEAAPSDGD